MTPGKTNRDLTAYRNVHKNILQKRNMKPICSNYLLLLQLYTANKKIANNKTAKLPASYYVKHPQKEAVPEYTPVHIQQKFLLLLNAKSYLYKTVRRFAFFMH